MIIDHIGIVVKSIEKGIEHWEQVFKYSQLTDVVVNKRQKVKVVFLTKKNSLNIKLLEPMDKSSSIYRFAMKGGGLHHICFKCEDVDDELKRLSRMGLRILTPPEPGEAFDNENIAFIYDNHGMNIELIDTDKKANLLNRQRNFTG